MDSLSFLLLPELKATDPENLKNCKVSKEVIDSPANMHGLPGSMHSYKNSLDSFIFHQRSKAY